MIFVQVCLSLSFDTVSDRVRDRVRDRDRDKVFMKAVHLLLQLWEEFVKIRYLYR
jgi:hypothetical protein